MNPASPIPLPSADAADADLPAFDPVEVVRIKLHRCGGCAVVSELRAADRLVAAWAACAGAERSLGFELTFGDGQTVCGRYDYGHLRQRVPSLSRYLRGVHKRAPDAWPRGTGFLTVSGAALARCGFDERA